MVLNEDKMEQMDYTGRWIERVKELNKITRTNLPPLSTRKEESSEMIEEYLDNQGVFPPSYWISRLATYVLAGTLKNGDRDKVANNDYPILSFSQLRRRKSKRFSVKGEHIDYLYSKFVDEMDSLAKTRNPNDYDD